VSVRLSALTTAYFQPWVLSMLAVYGYWKVKCLPELTKFASLYPAKETKILIYNSPPYFLDGLLL
jgi:hypothetical protein